MASTPEGDPRLPCGSVIPGLSAFVLTLTKGPPLDREGLAKEQTELQRQLALLSRQQRQFKMNRAATPHPPLLLSRRSCCGAAGETFQEAAVEKRETLLKKQLEETQRRLRLPRPSVLLSSLTYASFQDPVEFVDFLLRRSVMIDASDISQENSTAMVDAWGLGLVDLYKKKRASKGGSANSAVV